MNRRFRYLRDIHYRIFGIYYNEHIVKTNPNYCGLIIDDKVILSDSDFDIMCSEQIARSRLKAVAKAYFDTLYVKRAEKKAKLNSLFGITIRESDILYNDTDSTIVNNPETD